MPDNRDSQCQSDDLNDLMTRVFEGGGKFKKEDVVWVATFDCLRCGNNHVVGDQCATCDRR